jgi:fluoride exporter
MTLLLVLVGGAVGAIVRYLLHHWMLLLHHLPWGTFAANLAGSFALGLLSGFAAGAGGLPDWVRLLAGVGFCGALTTYSTFGLETVRLAQAGARRHASINAGVTVLVALGASWLGWFLSS